MSENDDFLSAVEDGSALLATIEEQARQLAQATKDRAEMLDLLRDWADSMSMFGFLPMPQGLVDRLHALLARFP